MCLLEDFFELQTISGEHLALYGYRWLRAEEAPAKAIVIIVHGMGEHSGRYRSFGQFLCEQNYVVYAYDQRGHGKTGQKTNSRGYLGNDGFRQLVRDAHQVIDYARCEYPGRPVILLGHSLGSFVVQSFLTFYGSSIDACVLCGTNGPEGIILEFGRWIARRYARRFGVYAESDRLTKLTFGIYNRKFHPSVTAFDWLSRDRDQVQSFLSDDMCGFPLSAMSMYDMFTEMRNMYRPHRLRNIPKGLPIYVMSGQDDPVGHMGKGIKKLLRIYRRYGLNRVTCRLYPNARHELLHEINRTDVYLDTLNWFESEVIASDLRARTQQN